DGFFVFFQAEDGIRVFHVTGVQTCALPISPRTLSSNAARYASRSSSSTVALAPVVVATLTTTSTRPSSRTVVSTSARHCSRSDIDRKSVVEGKRGGQRGSLESRDNDRPRQE